MTEACLEIGRSLYKSIFIASRGWTLNEVLKIGLVIFIVVVLEVTSLSLSSLLFLESCLN